jgi:hypothetical protein
MGNSEVTKWWAIISTLKSAPVGKQRTVEKRLRNQGSHNQGTWLKEKN